MPVAIKAAILKEKIINKPSKETRALALAITP